MYRNLYLKTSHVFQHKLGVCSIDTYAFCKQIKNFQVNETKLKKKKKKKYINETETKIYKSDLYEKKIKKDQQSYKV